MRMHKFILPPCGDFGQGFVRWKINEGTRIARQMAIDGALYIHNVLIILFSYAFEG